MSLLGKERREHFGKEMGQIHKLHSVHVHGLHDYITRSMSDSWPWVEQSRAFVRGMTQWALPDLLEIEEHHGRLMGKLKAGSS